MTETTAPREILQSGRDCTAFVVRAGDRANVHILRHGQPPLTVLGADLRTMDAVPNSKQGDEHGGTNLPTIA